MWVGFDDKAAGGENISEQRLRRCTPPAITGGRATKLIQQLVFKSIEQRK